MCCIVEMEVRTHPFGPSLREGIHGDALGCTNDLWLGLDHFSFLPSALSH